MTSDVTPEQAFTILNVDDDEAGRYTLTKILDSSGYAVVEAASGSETLRLVHDGIDLVILDINLPDISGFEVCRKIKEKPELDRVQVLHLTATYQDDCSLVKGLEGGADGYLTQPVEPSVLLATVKAMLRARTAEKQVTEAAGQWQATFDAINDGVALLGQEGTILRCNRALAKILRTSIDEILGCSHEQIIAGDREQLDDSPFQRLRRSGRREQITFEEGGRWFTVTVDPLSHESEDFSGAVLILSDITIQKRAEEERRSLEAQVQRTQKLESLGVLAGGIAHDFNNLLVGILGNAELAHDDLMSGGPVRDRLHGIEVAAKRASELCLQLLAYAGKGSIVVETLDLNALIREMVNLIEVSISKKIKLGLDLGAELPAVRADVTQLRQVILNLVTNASEAVGDQSGSITVTTGSVALDWASLMKSFAAFELQPGRYVFLEVRDSGAGMTPDTSERIFDPFFTTKFTGRGLGLAAVMGIVRGHCGAISVDSNEGAGTTFMILLPAIQELARAVPEANDFIDDFRHDGTALLVDDEQAVRDVVKIMLEKSGLSVLTAEDGVEALKVFRQHLDDIDIVLLDLTMPNMGGKDTFQAIRSISKSVPVILASGYHEQEITSKFAGEGFSGFLQKPYTRRELLKSLSRLMQKEPS